MAHFEYAFAPRTDDVDLRLSVEGDIPRSIVGTFYAMCAGGTRVGEQQLNLLDAHGRVAAIAIDGQQAQLRARMVDTPLWQSERGATRIAKRRLFDNKPSRWSNLFDTDLANPAAHNVVPFGDALLAAADPGFFALDPHTLATRGAWSLAPKKGATFGPMPRRDPSTGRLVVLEVRPGAKDTLIVREVQDDLGIKVERTFRLRRGAAFFHDLAFTERYYLVMQWGSISVPQFLWGARPPIDALRFDPAKTPMLHLLPRQGGAPISIPMPGRVHFHFWNAFDDGGKLIVDTIGYDGAVTFGSLKPLAARREGGASVATPASAIYRYTVDPAAGTLAEERLSELTGEAPEIRPDRRGRRYRYGWAPTLGGAGDEEDRYSFTWFHGMARHDFEARTAQVWDAGPAAFVSPAAFVPEPGGAEEDAGHVLALVQDAATQSSSLAVFDARDVARGPIARITGAPLLGGVTHVAYAGTGASS